jgi:hypothetical protein
VGALAQYEPARFPQDRKFPRPIDWRQLHLPVGDDMFARSADHLVIGRGGLVQVVVVVTVVRWDPSCSLAVHGPAAPDPPLQHPPLPGLKLAEGADGTARPSASSLADTHPHRCAARARCRSTGWQQNGSARVRGAGLSSSLTTRVILRMSPPVTVGTRSTGSPVPGTHPVAWEQFFACTH